MKYLDVPSSGSIADRTHSHNRAGQYTRNRRAPVQPPGTGRRAFIRSSFGNASTLWASLSFGEQQNWASYADGHPYTDSLGQAIKLTGHQMYVAINTQLANCQALPTSTPPVSDANNNLAPLTVTATAGTPSLSVDWVNGTADDYALIAFSRPLSPGRTFPPAFWQAAAVDQATAPYNALSAYVAQFGPLVAGKRIFCKVTPVNQYGVTGTPVIKMVTVAA